jgi:ABC-2 type transport system ATP-binding protein
VKTVIETSGLTKYYGRVRGVEDLDLQVGEGEVFGFLGPNGAGKTTTIRLLMGLLRPDRGQARVNGFDAWSQAAQVRAVVGNLPGEFNLYENLTGEQFLRFFAALRGSEDLSYAREVAKRFDLDLSRRVSGYSRGMKQKLALIQAVMHRPPLLLLDEPTAGLDPLMQQEFYHLVDEIHAGGQTIFLSSHFLPEVERVCSRVGIIRQGTLVAVEEIDALKAKAFRWMTITFAHDAPVDEFAGLSEVGHLERRNNRALHFTVSGPLDAIIKMAARFSVVDLEYRPATLEEIFLTYYAKEGNDATQLVS